MSYQTDFDMCGYITPVFSRTIPIFPHDASSNKLEATTEATKI